ncbi:haloacid dehalogenase [Sulfuriferula plumbiphila]|uniref:(S)-2-haloacid dehalogenase n=1 Tax=Sulfuriferula plumbiphila TaxID=171865 RepID=A0A512LAA8_9PROT|nr:haloacid dehalogenase type II [Sulfuriferula plumbiphila]BBP03110.1 haloacid dehalogenase [Sulfuriferula plumbiphila]GEP31410.1 haloacid dehalogenase [Sulfuriferula plumbiphila]
MKNCLPGVRTLVFDAYGTLLDVSSAAAALRNELADKAIPLAALWRDKQLQYTWLRSLQDRYVDFWQVTSEALEFAMQTLGIQDASMHAKLMDMYRALKAFPEVANTLRRLKEAGFVTAILSNGSTAMLQSAVRSAGVEHLLDAILSVDAVRVYKPHPRVYQMAVDHLGIDPQEICFQSSNAWDAHAASAFGMRVVWCNRYGQQPERLPGKPDFQIKTLDELPGLLGLD